MGCLNNEKFQFWGRVFLVNLEPKSSMGSSFPGEGGRGYGILCQEYPILCDFDKKIYTLDLATASQICVETNEFCKTKERTFYVVYRRQNCFLQIHYKGNVFSHVCLSVILSFCHSGGRKVLPYRATALPPSAQHPFC